MPSGNYPELEAAIAAARAHVDDMNERGTRAGSGITNEIRIAGYEALANAQRALAAARGEQYAIELDLGFKPEAAVSGAALIQSEYSAVLMFNTTKGRAVATLAGCSVTKFGYPNDEALAGHPLYDHGLSAYGVFEVLNSEWIELTVRQNQVSFPETRKGTGRHFIFTFHDSTFECIASGLSTSLETGSDEKTTADVVRRVFAD